MKIAVLPGSFDPITLGHESLVIRALPLFDKIIVAIGNNSEKKYCFPLEKRVEFIKATFASFPKVEVEKYSGLTIDFCRTKNSGFIIRGLRNSTDFEFEKNIAQINKAMSGVETVFFITDPQLSAISSTIVRDVYRNKGDIKPFVPSALSL